VEKEVAATSDQIVLELKDDGTYAINSKTVAKSDLDAQFHEIYDNRPAKLLFVRVGGTRKYQELIDAMDIARGAGVQVVGLTPPQEAQQGGQ
jgi:biopolymer transport protein ExbD